MKSYILLLVLTATAFPSSAAQASDDPSIAVLNGTLIDGNGGTPRPHTTVLIKGDRIDEIGPAGKLAIPKNARQIDAGGHFILPGFIDVHSHVTYPPDSGAQSQSLAVLRAMRQLDVVLRSGVTSVKDLGAEIEPVQALLQGRDLGYIKTARLYAVGQIITTKGGHGRPFAYEANGADGFRLAVRTMFAAGFEYIKLSPTYTDEEIGAAIDEAQTLGMLVTTHGGGESDTVPPSMTRLAVLAGTRSIEHLNPMDDEVLDLIAARGVYIVPTLEVYKRLYEAGTLKHLETGRNWNMNIHENLFRKALERNIIMGIGTDAVPPVLEGAYPDIYFDEMKNFLRLGMTLPQVITTATRNGAIILGKEDQLGTLESGKLADLQIVEKDPMQSLDALGAPMLVMVGGEVLHEMH